jgi:hypothetical protein
MFQLHITRSFERCSKNFKRVDIGKDLLDGTVLAGSIYALKNY